MDYRLLSFSGIYQEQDFWREQTDNDVCSRFYDLSQLTGTRGYLSEEAAAALTALLSQFPADKPILTFIDSGNYHYMASLLTGRIHEDFALLLLDHHPDMQLPAFEGMLSCGSWVRAALTENPHLRTVWMLGIDRQLADEALRDDPGKWAPDDTIPGVSRRDFLDKTLYLLPDLPGIQTAAPDDPVSGSAAGRAAQTSAPADPDPLHALLREILRRSPLPFYLSIDKDVLSAEELHTDWDQGTLSTATLYAIVRFFTDHARLLGADICGECDRPPASPLQYLKENDRCNANLLDIFRNAR